MKLEDLKKDYDRLQLKYGAKELDSIYNGGECINPDIAFVFMNPTGRNIASSKNWKGLKSPWIGTKNIWTLFYNVGLLDDDVYENVKKHKVFITNLGKCTQIDARPLPDEVYKKYLNLFKKEMEIVNPKVIILFGNQVSSIVLDEKISVSNVRKKLFVKKINNKVFNFYSVFYPIGNGSFNVDKSIENIKWIISNMEEKYENSKR